MSKRLRFLFILAITSLFALVPVAAQIGGIIQDSETLQPIERVNISVVGTEHGTSTSEEGIFYLNVSEFPVEISFSVIGYEVKTLIFEHPGEELVVLLDASLMGLEEIVVIPDRTMNPITKSSPIARSTVNIEQLSSKSVTTAVELLRAETGVFVQQTSVGQGSIYIRGRAGRDVLYLFNGFRMNPSFVRSGQNQYFGAIDPLLLSQLDVYRGPVSVYYGSDALSGGVNVSPIIKDFSTEEKISGEVSSFFNFEGNGEKTGHAKLFYQTPTVSIFAGGTYRDFDYYNMSSQSDEALWFPYDETLSNADYQFQSYQVSSRIRTGINSNVTLVSYRGEVPDAPRLDRQTLGYSIEGDYDEDLRPQYGYYSNTSPLVFWGNTAEYRMNTASPIFQELEVRTAYFRLQDFRKEQDFAYYDVPTYSVNTGEIDDTFSLSDTMNYDRNESNQIHTSIDVQSRLTRHLYIKWGGDISYDKISSERISNYDETHLPRYPDGSKYVLSGFFAQIDYSKTQAFSVEYGIRYSHAYADIPFEGSDTERQYDPYSDSFGQFTQSLGLTYKFSEEVTLLNNISTGFRAPNIADLSEIGTRGSGQFQTPNTDLQPEKTLNLDIGMQYQDDAYSLEVYSFWLHYFDKISRVETGDIVNVYGESVTEELNGWDTYTEVTNQNVNSMDLLGIEFSGEFVNNNELKTGLTFTYTWGELTNPDGSKEPVNRIPPANGVFYVDYTPVLNLSIRPQARYAFAHRRISPVEENDIRVSQDGTDGFVNLQLLVNYQPKEKVNLKFVADNIMDAAYREHASSLDGMGRNYTVSVSYSF